MKPPMIILTDPTAVGETAMSIQLARAIGGEIISADSIQVYHHMDVGSAKAAREEMDGVPHYLTGVLESWEDFNVAVFKRIAKEAMDGILSRGNIPIVTGGIGFYTQVLLYDIDFTEYAGDGAIYTELEQLVEDRGTAYLHQILTEINPESGPEIHANNIKRVIRIVKYYRQAGEPIPLYNRRERERESPYSSLHYAVNTERSILYECTERRTDMMTVGSLVEGAQALKDMGCIRNLASIQGLGYKGVLDYLDGECTLEEAVYILKWDTRHFTKRQITWFRRGWDVRWLNPPSYDDDTARVTARIVANIKEECLIGESIL